MQVNFDQYCDLIVERLLNIKMNNHNTIRFDLQKAEICIAPNPKFMQGLSTAAELTNKIIETAKCEDKSINVETAQSNIIEILNAFKKNILSVIDSLYESVLTELFPKPLASNFIEDLADGVLNDDSELIERVKLLLKYLSKNVDNKQILQNIKKLSNFEANIKTFEKETLKAITCIKDINIYSIPSSFTNTKNISQCVDGEISIGGGLAFSIPAQKYAIISKIGSLSCRKIEDDSEILKHSLPFGKNLTQIPTYLAWNITGENLATFCPFSKKIYVYDVGIQKRTEINYVSPHEISFLMWTTKNSFLVANTAGEISIYIDWKEPKKIVGPQKVCTSKITYLIKFNEENQTNKLCIASNSEGHLIMLDGGSLKTIWDMPVYEIAISCLAISKNNKFLASACKNKQVKLIALETKSIVFTAGFPDIIYGIFWGLGDEYLIGHGYMNKTIYIIDKKEGLKLKEHTVESNLSSILPIEEKENLIIFALLSNGKLQKLKAS